MPPKKPTPPPLSSRERAAYQQLITRAARTLPPTEGNLLIRFHRTDDANRGQQNSVIGGLERALHQLRAQLRAAEHQTTRYRTAWHSARRRATS